MADIDNLNSVIDTQKIKETKEIRSAKDIFKGNPKEDSKKLEKVVKNLEKTFNLPSDIVSNILDTLSKVHNLEIQKEQVPINVATYIGENGEVPKKIA